jgi:hypothetical protein
MNISDLEKQLQSAQDRLQKVLKTQKSRSGSARDAMQVSDDVAAAKRALAAAMGEEYAVPYNIGFVPEAAVSGPVLLQTDYVTILTFITEHVMSDGKRHDCSDARFARPIQSSNADKKQTKGEET